MAGPAKRWQHRGCALISIAIDARPLTKLHDGISRFLWQLVQHLGAEPGFRLLLLSHRPLYPAALPSNAEVIVDSAWARIPGSVWFALRFPTLARRAGAGLVWGTQHVLPPRGGLLVPRLLTVHDFVFKQFPETMHSYNRLTSNLLVGRSITSADRVICDTRFTLEQLRAYYPQVPDNRAEVIHLAAVALPPAEPMAGPLPARFLFALGSLEPRKNIAQFVRVFAKLAQSQPDLNLVLAGGARWNDGDIWSTVEQCGLQQRVQFVGRISDGQIRHCLQHCEAFVFPSVYEGFGLPVLEAAGIARRIVLNDIAVLREVGAYVQRPDFVDFSNTDLAARQLGSVLVAESATEDDVAPVPMRDWGTVASDYAAVIRQLAHA